MPRPRQLTQERLIEDRKRCREHFEICERAAVNDYAGVRRETLTQTSSNELPNWTGARTDYATITCPKSG